MNNTNDNTPTTESACPTSGNEHSETSPGTNDAFQRLSLIISEVAGSLGITVSEQASDAAGDAAPPAAEQGPLVDPTACEAPAAPAAVVDQPSTWVSFGLMTDDHRAVPVKIPILLLAQFLNAVGHACVAQHLVDIQFWLQKRVTKGPAGLLECWGLVADIDRPTSDVLGEVQKACLRVPNCHFKTMNGFKVLYVFTRAATKLEAEAWAKAVTLSFAGGDPLSWLMSQGQRLPACLKTTDTGLVEVNFQALLSNPKPLDPALAGLVFPERFRSILSDSRLTPDARQAVEDYLSDSGTPAPDEPGSRLYQSCPDSTHDDPCTYVRREETGEVRIVCLGGHGGEGTKRWSENRLAVLAGVDVKTVEAGFDIVSDVRMTWAAVRLVEHRLAGMPAVVVRAVVDVLVIVKAVQEADEEGVDHGRLDLVLYTFRRRLDGEAQVGPLRLHFSDGSGGLAVIDRDDRVRPIIHKSDALSSKNHFHKYIATSAWRVQSTEDGVFVGPTGDSASLFNMALGGHPGALAALGIPVVRTFDLPVAHVAESWEVGPAHREVRGVVPYRWKNPELEPVEPVSFFERLFNQGRFPLASLNDVLIFLMALASPLLRHIGQGQLGIYWLHGPVGAGKDYLAEMKAKIWERIARPGRQVAFDLAMTDDLELKRSMHSGTDAVFARAKEAGKRRGIADLLIRLAGTNYIAARGMRRDEVTIPNLLTIIADSAEDVPERREVSRRTAMIEVAFIDDKVSKGEVLREVLDNAEGLLLGLTRLVESKPAEWYRSQSNLGSRPIIPVALSRLLGATLPIVKGRDLDDIFDAMLEYTSRFAGDEGEKQRSKSREKDGKDACRLKHYRFSTFIETMRKQIGYGETFESHKASSLLVTWITRETHYNCVDRGESPYLPVIIGDSRYAFKIVKGRRNFVLLPEAEFCAAMECQSVGRRQRPGGPAAPTSPNPAVAAATPTANEPMTFTESDLQGNDDDAA